MDDQGASSIAQIKASLLKGLVSEDLSSAEPMKFLFRDDSGAVSPVEVSFLDLLAEIYFYGGMTLVAEKLQRTPSALSQRMRSYAKRYPWASRLWSDYRLTQMRNSGFNVGRSNKKRRSA